MADGQVVIVVGADTKSFDKQIEAVERELQQLEKSYQTYSKNGKIREEDRADYEKLAVEIEKTSNKLVQLKAQRDKLNQQPPQEFNKSLTDTGNKISDIINRVGRWALAVFSVRTAYNLISRASSTLAQYNEQYAVNLEYIRYALAQALAPILEYVVNLAYKLLAYVNYIAQAWFGVNLFANASADSFNKAKNNLSGANKSAKELQKTLLGFDEMNILNSTSTGGGGGVAVGGLLPTFDLANMNDIKIPDWVKWIGDNKDTILSALGQIVALFIAFKGLQFAGVLESFITGFARLATTLGAFKMTVAALGIALVFVGIANAIEGVIKFIQDPSWSNFEQILGGLETAILGVSIALIALNATNPVGWIILIVDAIAMLITQIMECTGAFNDLNDAESNSIKIGEELRASRERLNDVMNGYISAVDKAEQTERELQEAQQETGILIDDLLKLMSDENLSYKELDESQRKVYKAYVNNNQAQENLDKSTRELIKTEEKHQEKVYKAIGLIERGTSSYKQYRDAIIDLYDKGVISAEEGSMAMMHAMENMDNDTKRIFTESLPSSIKSGLNPDKYSSWASGFKSWWNNSFIGGLNTTLRLSATGSATGFKVGGYVTKLATGALINNPGKGVPVSRAIAGEAGTERNNSFDRYTSNGKIRRKYRKIYNDKCKYCKSNEW